MHFLSGNMEKILENNLLKHLMPFIPLSNSQRNSQEKKNFIDVNVRLKNRQLETDLYIKPTDTHQFLDETSCHPYHCKECVPIGRL